MLGAFLVFCVCIGAVLWHLMNEAEKERVADDSQKQGGATVTSGRKRNRRKHGGELSSSHPYA